MFKHQQGIGIVCDKCGFRFKSKASLEAHVRRKHSSVSMVCFESKSRTCKCVFVHLLFSAGNIFMYVKSKAQKRKFNMNLKHIDKQFLT